MEVVSREAERGDFNRVRVVDGVIGKIIRSVVAGEVAVAGDPTDNRDFRSDPIVKNVVDDVKCFVDGRGFTELSFGDEGIDKVAVSEDKYIEFVNLGPIG